MGVFHGVFVLGTLLVLTLANVHTEKVRRATSCPSGWTFSNNACYAVIKDTQNWMEAQLSCQALNAHLVIISSEAENQAVWFLLNSKGGDDTGVVLRAWLGLTDLLVDGQFEWINSDAPSYTNWADAEPSGTYNDLAENCAEMISDGYWNDQACNTPRDFFVCEQE